MKMRSNVRKVAEINVAEGVYISDHTHTQVQVEGPLPHTGP